jgi:hypothetical protein
MVGGNFEQSDARLRPRVRHGAAEICFPHAWLQHVPSSSTTTAPVQVGSGPWIRPEGHDEIQVIPVVGVNARAAPLHEDL